MSTASETETSNPQSYSCREARGWTGDESEKRRKTDEDVGEGRRRGRREERAGRPHVNKHPSRSSEEAEADGGWRDKRKRRRKGRKKRKRKRKRKKERRKDTRKRRKKRRKKKGSSFAPWPWHRPQ